MTNAREERRNELKRLSRAALVARAAELGLRLSGTKDDLARRIVTRENFARDWKAIAGVLSD